MKTIEERAREYAARTWQNDPEKQCPANLGYRAGAIAERAELTRWNDPKEPPECGTEVLVKYSDGRVFMARYENSEFGWACYEPRGEMTYGVKDGVIVGWRPIHE